VSNSISLYERTRARGWVVVVMVTTLGTLLRKVAVVQLLLAWCTSVRDGVVDTGWGFNDGGERTFPTCLRKTEKPLQVGTRTVIREFFLFKKAKFKREIRFRL